MGRTPIRAKDSPGFIANRLARPFSLESLRMLADGVADAETIDRVCRLGGGFRMGPFELIDLIGLDVNLSVARSFYAQGGEPERWRPSPIQEGMVAEGRLGRKSGERLLRATATGHHREPDPELGHRGADPRPRRAGADRPRRRRRSFPASSPRSPTRPPSRSKRRSARPTDMDTAMRLGFNWPLGPLEFTELIGAGRAVDLLEALAREAARPTPRRRRCGDGRRARSS